MVSRWPWHKRKCLRDLLSSQVFLFMLVHVGFFWTFFLCGVNTQMRRHILSHLFKWRRVRLGWERDSFVRKKPVTKHWERNVRKNHCDFRTPTRKCFSDCNCGFIHRWIELIFGKHVLHMWYFQLFGWITENLFGEEDK